jgi:L-methionine (R)-S-oxide reductase
MSAGRQSHSSSAHDEALAAITVALRDERDAQRAMQRAVSILKESVPFYSWVGIYLLEENELVLGPFLGKPSPHSRIPLGSGICGAAATEQQTIIVDDVNADPRYLACSIETRSEIVVPIMDANRVLGEIDIDSDQPAAFGAADRKLLEEVAALLVPKLTDLPPKGVEPRRTEPGRTP